jgi:hypothetical protein
VPHRTANEPPTTHRQQRTANNAPPTTRVL